VFLFIHTDGRSRRFGLEKASLTTGNTLGNYCHEGDPMTDGSQVTLSRRGLAPLSWTIHSETSSRSVPERGRLRGESRRQSLPRTRLRSFGEM